MSNTTNTSSTGNRFSAFTIACMGFLTALVIVLELVASGVRVFGAFNITLVLIPIVIGAAFFGWIAGAWLGMVFGLTVLLSGQASLFMGWNAFGTIVTVMAKGIGCGALTGLVFTSLQKAKVNLGTSTVVSAIVAPVVNTGIFFLGCLIFFASPIKDMGEGKSLVTAILTVFIGLNFPVELGVNLVLSSAVIYLISYLRKSGLVKKVTTNKK